MRWSWPVGSLAGIELRMHATFPLLLVYVALVYGLRGGRAAALDGVVLISVVFAVVVIHELAHALAARRFGIRTHSITLLPIGGVAQLERIPEGAKEGLAVALAGPAVNVILAAALFGALAATGHPISAHALLDENAPFLERLAWINVVLAVFNLLPAFPMDGGRVLRSLLVIWLAPVRATRWAAYVGRGMAVLFAALGLLGNPMLILIAVFVWFGAGAEAAESQFRAGLSGLQVRHAAISEFQVVSPRDSLSEVMRHVLAGFQAEFPVVEDGRAVGVLTRSDLVRALAARGPESIVGDAMQSEFASVRPDASLEEGVAALRNSPSRVVLVVDGDRVVGLLTAENLGELLVFRGAIERGPRRR